MKSPTEAAMPPFSVEARFCEPLPEGMIRCQLCPHLCVVAEDKRGHCGVRENHGGRFYSLVYGRICTAHVDPIEKKPFFHVLPGSRSFSIATAGCNIDCSFCQNASISCARPEDLPAEQLAPQDVTALALRFQSATIAFTYGEPTISAEFVQDTAAEARAQGVKTLVVSNGYIQPQALKAAWADVDAIKIDLKSFREAFYRNVTRSSLKPVLKTLVTLRELNRWTEVVCLLIPTLNDSDAELTEMARWMHSNLGPDVPLHFSRFHPDHQLNQLSPTPVATLERARAIALGEGLRYVYIGNLPGHPAQHTYCPRCQSIVVERTGFVASHLRLQNGCCEACGEPIAGLWH